MQPVKVPVVESLLRAPSGNNGFVRFGLADQRLHLAALHSLGQEGTPKFLNAFFRIRNSRSQNLYAAFGRMRLFQSRKPGQRLSRLRAH